MRPGVLAAFGVALAAATGLMRLALGPAGLSDTGVVVVVGHLFSLTATLVLLAALWAIGRPFARALRLPIDGAVDSIVFSVAFGGGIAATAYLALGAVGALHSAALWGLPLVAAGCALWAEARGGASDAEARGTPGGSARGPAGPGIDAEGLPPLWAAAVFVAVGVFLVVQGLPPASDWDAVMYHLRIPAQLLEHGALYVPEDNLHITRIGLFQMLYLPLLGIGADAGPSLISAAFTLLTGVAAFALADRFFGRRAAWLTIVTVWGSTTIIMVGMTPRVDVAVAFYTLVAHYAVMLALGSAENDEPGHVLTFVAAGVLTGFAMGVKIQALLYVLGLGPIVLWAAARRGRLVVLTTIAAGTLVVSSAPWLLKNLLMVGAPLYPALSAPRLEPWLARLYGGSAYPADFDAGLTRLVWEFRDRLNFVDFFLNPGRLSIESEAIHYHGNPILLLLPFGLLTPRRREMIALAVPAVLYLVALLWQLPEANLRYLIPGLLPLTIVAVLGLEWLMDRAPPPSRRWIAAGACVVALLGTGHTMTFFTTWTPAPAHAMGAEPGLNVIRVRAGPAAGLIPTGISEHPTLDRPDARTLMLFDARGYYFDGRVIQDNLLLNWYLITLSPDFGSDWCPGDAGFTHVLVNAGALDHYRRAGLDPDRLGWSLFPAVADRCLEEVGGGFGLHLFRDTTRGAPAD